MDNELVASASAPNSTIKSKPPLNANAVLVPIPVLTQLIQARQQSLEAASGKSDVTSSFSVEADMLTSQMIPPVVTRPPPTICQPCAQLQAIGAHHMLPQITTERIDELWRGSSSHEVPQCVYCMSRVITANATTMANALYPDIDVNNPEALASALKDPVLLNKVMGKTKSSQGGKDRQSQNPLEATGTDDLDGVLLDLCKIDGDMYQIAARRLEEKEEMSYLEQQRLLIEQEEKMQQMSLEDQKENALKMPSDGGSSSNNNNNSALPNIKKRATSVTSMKPVSLSAVPTTRRSTPDLASFRKEIKMMNRNGGNGFYNDICLIDGLLFHIAVRKIKKEDEDNALALQQLQKSSAVLAHATKSAAPQEAPRHAKGHAYKQPPGEPRHTATTTATATNLPTLQPPTRSTSPPNTNSATSVADSMQPQGTGGITAADLMQHEKMLEGRKLDEDFKAVGGDRRVNAGKPLKKHRSLREMNADDLPAASQGSAIVPTAPATSKPSSKSRPNVPDSVLPANSGTVKSASISIEKFTKEDEVASRETGKSMDEEDVELPSAVKMGIYDDICLIEGQLHHVSVHKVEDPEIERMIREDQLRSTVGSSSVDAPKLRKALSTPRLSSGAYATRVPPSSTNDTANNTLNNSKIGKPSAAEELPVSPLAKGVVEDVCVIDGHLYYITARKVSDSEAKALQQQKKLLLQASQSEKR